jgi:hypothetical protein
MKSVMTMMMLLAIASPARTETRDGALTLTPAVITLRGSDGQTTTQTLRLTNGTSQDFFFEVVAEDLVVRKGERVSLRAGEIAGSIAATAVVSQRSGVAHAGETVAVKVTLTLPPRTSCRAVVILFRGTRKLMSGGAAIRANIGALLTFAMSNDVALNAAPVLVTPPSTSANASFSNVCVNNGREPVVARGVLAILNEAGLLIGRANIAPRRLLPNERADIRVEYPGDLAPGKYAVLLTLGYEGKTLVQRGSMVVR